MDGQWTIDNGYGCGVLQFRLDLGLHCIALRVKTGLRLGLELHYDNLASNLDLCIALGQTIITWDFIGTLENQ